MLKLGKMIENFAEGMANGMLLVSTHINTAERAEMSEGYLVKALRQAAYRSLS